MSMEIDLVGLWEEDQAYNCNTCVDIKIYIKESMFWFYQVLESQMRTVHQYSTVSAVVGDLNPGETLLIMIEM